MTPLGRAGVVVPPENPTVEAELALWKATELSIVTARLPVEGGNLRGRLKAYDLAMVDTVRCFGELPLDVVYFACTGASYLHGDDGEAWLAEQLATVTTATLVTAAQAVARCLQRAGITSVVLISPYPAWLTTEAISHWSDHGLEVRDVVSIDTESTGIYNVPEEVVASALQRAARGDPAAILVTGTGLATGSLLSRWNRSQTVPALSSNLAAIIEVSHLVCGSSRPAGALSDATRDAWARWLPR